MIGKAVSWLAGPPGYHYEMTGRVVAVGPFWLGLMGCWRVEYLDQNYRVSKRKTVARLREQLVFFDRVTGIEE